MYNNGSSNHIHHVIKLPICAGNFVSTNKSCSSSVIDQKFHVEYEPYIQRYVYAISYMVI